MGFETFALGRPGRKPERDPVVTLSEMHSRGKVHGQWLKISQSALDLIGIHPKARSLILFVVDVDRDSGAIRLTPTGDRSLGRSMSIANRELYLPQSFRDWTGWGASRWSVHATPSHDALVGDKREVVSDEPKLRQSRVEGS